MKDLNLSNLINLEVLKANNNKIENFSYSNIPKLEKMYIFNNQLEAININDLPSLQYMDCRQNPMPDSLYDEMDKVDNTTFLHDGNADDW
jgi:Leucine-rich repeat (LRR) protein